MTLTGRVPLLVLLGLVPVVLRPTAGTVWLWVLTVALVVLLDWWLAPRPTLLALDRPPVGSVRLGEPTQTLLRVDNPSRRRVRGVVRDAWQPTAGAEGNRHPLLLGPGERTTCRTTLTPRRRGDLRTAGPRLPTGDGPAQEPGP